MALARKKVASSSNLLENQACNSNVAVGDWVYLDASSVAQRALADTVGTSKVLGVVNSKASTILANIVLPGSLTSSIFSSLDTTKNYFLSDVTPGAMVDESAIPTLANHVVLQLGKAISATRFAVDLGERVVRA